MLATKWCVAVACATAMGCASELRNPERFSNVDSCGDVEELLEQSCAGAGCHASENSAAALDLTSAGLIGRLADEAGSDNCGNALLVDSSDIAGSLLLDKLSAQPSCGATMPLGGAPFSADEIACVQAYLEDEL